ncbi:MAG: hypothetical protein ACM3Q0_01820 [Bacteroidota bacterium]
MAEVTTDHETVRKWAESKGGEPAAIERTHKGGDVGIIRIMFPGAPQSQHDALTEITWEEFFEEFEKRKLALGQPVLEDRRPRHGGPTGARRPRRGPLKTRHDSRTVFIAAPGD